MKKKKKEEEEEKETLPMKRKIRFFAIFLLNTNCNDETFYRNIAYLRTHVRIISQMLYFIVEKYMYNIHIYKSVCKAKVKKA